MAHVLLVRCGVRVRMLLRLIYTVTHGSGLLLLPIIVSLHDAFGASWCGQVSV